LTLIVCSLAPIFSASSAKAQDGPFFSEETRFTLCPFSVNGSFGYAAQPYVAGYMTTDSLSGNAGREPGGAAAVNVTVSFSGTNKSVIQSDNFLATGICAQGPDTRDPPLVRIDWGYTLLLVLDDAEDDPYILGAVWKVYEWGRNGLWPLEPPDADLVDDWTWSYPGVLTINSEVTLTMEWDSSHLNYFATIGGVPIVFPRTLQSQKHRTTSCLARATASGGLFR
jgi:hypothetical protein